MRFGNTVYLNSIFKADFGLVVSFDDSVKCDGSVLLGHLQLKTMTSILSTEKLNSPLYLPVLYVY